MLRPVTIVEKFTTALGQALASALPEGFSLRVQGGRLEIDRLPEQPRSLDVTASILQREFAGAATMALSVTQDYITTLLRTPWPLDCRRLPADLCRPHAIVDGGLLRMWYGSKDRREFEFAPLEVPN